jgi:hypothetical protein
LATFAALEPDFKTFFNVLYEGIEYTLTYQSLDPRERFAVAVKAATELGVETLLKSLAGESANAYA